MAVCLSETQQGALCIMVLLALELAQMQGEKIHCPNYDARRVAIHWKR